jgi:tetratricopeptide (TPR) repeat protein
MTAQEREVDRIPPGQDRDVITLGQDEVNSSKKRTLTRLLLRLINSRLGVQKKEKVEDSPSSNGFEQLSLSTERLWVIVTRILGLSVIGYILFAVFAGRMIVIDHVSVDKAGHDYDNLSSILPMRISYQMFKFTHLSESERRHIGAAYGQPELDITVKSINLSASTLIEYLRANVTHADVPLHGYVSLANQDMTLTLWGESSDESFLEYTSKPYSDPDVLAKDAAENIVQNFDPFTFAASTFAEERLAGDGDHGRSLSVISKLLNKSGKATGIIGDDGQQSEEKAWLYNLWGLILVDRKQYEDAGEKFEIATQYYPSLFAKVRDLIFPTHRHKLGVSSIAYANLGDTLREMNKTEEALESYRRSHIWSDEFAPVWADEEQGSSGQAADSSGSTDRDISDRISRDRDNPALFLELGKVHLANGQVPQAESDFTMANKLANNDIAFLLEEGKFSNSNGHPEVTLHLLGPSPPSNWSETSQFGVWYELSIAYKLLGVEESASAAASHAIILLHAEDRNGRY